MAVEKGLVLAAIETKFKGKSISKTFKESLATKWAAKIEAETDIDNYINDREDVVLEASTEADRRVTEAVKIATEKNKDSKETAKTDEVVIDNDAPQWAKDLAKQNQYLAKKLDGFQTQQTQQTQQTLAERFKSNPELKKIPEFMFKGRIPQTEEEYQTAVEELKADYTTFATDNKLSNIGMDTPGNTDSNAGKNDAKIDPAIEAFAKKELTPKN